MARRRAFDDVQGYGSDDATERGDERNSAVLVSPWPSFAIKHRDRRTERYHGLTSGSYDMIKQQLLTRFSFKDNVPTHLLTALLGGTISVTACAPIDVFKSRIQSSPPGVVRPHILLSWLQSLADLMNRLPSPSSPNH